MLLNKNELFTILLVMAMVFVAQLFSLNDIIFPEIAALSFGAVVMEKCPWKGHPLLIWLSPTLGALTGVTLLHLVSPSFAVLVCLAFLLVALELKLFHSGVYPSISAAILPILLNVRSISYPVSVCIMAGILALILHTRTKKRQEVPVADTTKALPATGHNPVAFWVKIVALVYITAYVAYDMSWIYIISPPLLVVFVEATQAIRSGETIPRLRIVSLLSLAALAGLCWYGLIVLWLAGPVWLAAGLSVTTVFLLSDRLHLASPPAFALSLLPVILPQSALFWYPLQVLVGSSVFLLFSLYCFSPVKVAR